MHEAMQMILEDDDVLSADVYISPPDDGVCSEEDSGDENDGTVDNMSGNQLRASAEVVTCRSDGDTQTVGGLDVSEDEENDADGGTESGSDTARQPSLPPPKKRLSVPKNSRSWKKKYISCGLTTQQPWPPKQLPKFLREHQTPSTMFGLFFDDEVVENIVQQTMLYAKRDKGVHSFETNVDELRTFIAVLLISGYTNVPRRHMYWEQSSDVFNEAISTAMSRNRFDELMRYLHVSDNLHLDVADRFAKVRPLFSLLNERCLMFCPAEQHLSIDETMVPYFGRHPTKQFMRSKPVRFGYKLWCMATAGGYVVQFEPYAGAKNKSLDKAEFGLGGSVVLNLLSELPMPMPYHVSFDNFFTSVKLLEHLSNLGIAATGTIRLNRMEDCPLRKSFKSLEKAERGATEYMLDQSSNVVVVAWRDNKVVTLASNSVGVEPKGSASRWSRTEGQRVNVSQPNIVRLYNSTMGGVDRADQNVAAYRILMRTKKWYWPLFAYCIDAMMQNAWLLYRKSPAYQEKPLDLLAFRREVVHVYLMRHAQSARMGRPGRPQPLSQRVPVEIRQDSRGHYFSDSPTQRRCGQCGKNTRKQCTKCGIGLHLHCFNDFHGVI